MSKERKLLLTHVTYYKSELLRQSSEIDVALDLFDKIKVYTEPVMSEYATFHSNPLNIPTSILDIMKDMSDDDILLYSETSIPVKKKLKKWFKIASKHSAIFFFHGDTINEMTKMLMHDSYYKAKLLPFYNFAGRLFLLRKSSQYLIEEWRDRIANQGTNNEEPVNEGAILCSIIYDHLDDSNIKILFER